MLQKDTKPTTNTERKTAVIRYGGISFVSKKPEPGYMEMEGQNGIKIYVDVYRSVKGYITNLEFYQHKFQNGKSDSGLSIVFEDGEGDVLEVRVSSTKRAFDNITKSLFNVDFTKEVTLIAWVPKGKSYIAAMFLQKDKDGNEVKVPQRYTKDNLEDCPPAVFDPFTATWNFTAQRQWILTKILSEVKENIAKAASKRKSGIRQNIQQAPVPLQYPPVNNTPTAVAPAPIPDKAPAAITPGDAFEDEIDEEFEW